MPVTRRASTAAVIGLVCLLAACGGGEAGKSGDQILADAVAAFSSVHSYHIAGAMTNASGTTTFDFRIAGVRRLKGTLVAAGTSAEIVVVDGRIYVRGKEFLRKTAGDQVANRVGDHYAKLPARTDLSQFDQLSDTSLAAKCLLEQLGTTAKGKEGTLHNRNAIEIKGAGDKPGTFPVIIDVQTSDPTYPLHLSQMGPQKPGGTPPDPRCGRSDATSGQIDLSEFGASVDIAPPADVVDLST
jgi:hypothetical protein